MQTLTNTNLVQLNDVVFTPPYNQKFTVLKLNLILYRTIFGLVLFVQNLKSFTKLAKKKATQSFS